MKNIVIGSANFNQYYGLKKFKFNQDVLKNTIKLAKQNKIHYLDTAFEYNLNKKLLNNINFKNFKLISKVRLPKKNINTFLKNLENKILLELKLFKLKRYEAILFHNTKDLLSINGNLFLRTLSKLKRKKIIKNIGISIYEPRELVKSLKVFKPDIVQLPISIFDQRFIKNKWINKLKKKNIKIQARSIFLNGLVLKKINQLNNFKYSKEFKPLLIKYNIWCKQNNFSQLDLAISFIKNIKEIDLITIGFDNKSQLQEILVALNKKIEINFDNFNIVNRNITDPRKWE
tara:strand:- start:3053 stop:3916 length:864 start_codon:yes stop_codon:yes gene_type:complete